jgi:hypothetical protein
VAAVGFDKGLEHAGRVVHDGRVVVVLGHRELPERGGERVGVLRVGHLGHERARAHELAVEQLLRPRVSLHTIIVDKASNQYAGLCVVSCVSCVSCVCHVCVVYVCVSCVYVKDFLDDRDDGQAGIGRQTHRYVHQSLGKAGHTIDGHLEKAGPV